MIDKCFDIGTIQAFTDGELGSDRSERLLKHVSVCASCANVLSECEEDSALAFSVLDEELNVLVPTERLRNKVFASINEMESRRRSGWLNGLAAAFSFNNPGLTVAASILLVFGFIVIGVNFLGTGSDNGSVAGNVDPANDTVSMPSAETVAEDDVTVETPEVLQVAEDTVTDSDEVSPFRRRTQNARSIKLVDRQTIGDDPEIQPQRPRSLPAADTSVVSEDSYLQTIATLDRTVRYNKQILRPSERVEFERDLAVVNDAILKMKNEVNRNPDNLAAREMLKSSYQHKVDLLNSVAEKTELMASLQ
ncbi:MAG: hypothetical protein DWQ47_15340 [Acidobacteria bacterium]|nr:MAG: hypothetical protein DWQ32_02740 [Acidobacteriota bacterium]REK02564.1 MAG: hypothetical protein DWQ38_09395 [Acidobacteriota bacterium]REK13633.1 MAG: hypothetical protein DWQ43_08430 [Acidobacteriota bacterium]REK41627.1 MAG: hypothetical protein DWQ47_15340 [Acidobacteriota bacterium]